MFTHSLTLTHAQTHTQTRTTGPAPPPPSITSLSATALILLWTHKPNPLPLSDTVRTLGAGENCERFGGEGTGSHCLVYTTLLPDRTYTVRVELDSTNATGSLWLGTISDTESGATSEIGRLFYPNFGSFEGYGNLTISGNPDPINPH